jgi:hypothetical protein
MAITREDLHKFVREFGDVKLFDSTGQIASLKDGTSDTWAVIENADRFFFAGSWYGRADFERLMERMKSKPGTATQIG